MLVVAMVVLGGIGGRVAGGRERGAGSGGRGAGGEAVGGERETGVFHSETLSTTVCRMF